MIRYGRVRPYQDEGKTGLFIRGHAYGEQGDAVCAAVSGIGQTAIAACQRYDEDIQIRQCRKGHIVFICKKTTETEAIVCAALDGLDGVRKKYPQSFVEGVRAM